MFLIALIIGIYSNIILSLGFIGMLDKRIVAFLTFLFLISFFYNKKREILRKIVKLQILITNSDLVGRLAILTLGILFFVNLWGALSPEIAFDPLWYHLTLAKIYLSQTAIDHISGGLLYYSTMPKLVETLYVGALSISDEIGAHIIQLMFGFFSLIVTYRIARLFFDEKVSLIAGLIFYSNIVVAWESTTSFIDLGRVFFEALAFYSLLLWIKTKDNKHFYFSAIFIGLQISTKLIGIADLFIFSIIIFYEIRRFMPIIKYIAVSLFIPLPWFVFSLVSTGNPLYPVLSKVYPASLSTDLLNPIVLLNPINFLRDSISILIKAQDPISPIYLITLPLIIFILKKIKKEHRILLIYSILAFLVWYITPKTGGGRFIMTYLPVFSVAAVLPLIYYKEKLIGIVLIAAVFMVSAITIGYRSLAQMRYIPFFGNESKEEYLTKNLNYSFGDFYDTDNYFKENIKKSDNVLLYGFHNLYYVDFNFIDSSWVKTGDRFNYIATQDVDIPERFSYWNLIYYNPKTNVKVYSLGGQEWSY